MALGPNIATGSIRVGLLSQIEAEIDTVLRNPEQLQSNRRGSPENPCWFFSHLGSLNSAEKEELQSRYLKAGWAQVSVTNSEEQGERAGMIGIWLYLHKQAT